MQMLTCTICGGLTPLEISRLCLHCGESLRRTPRWGARLTVLLGPASALLLAACYGAPGRYRDDPKRGDADRDGVFAPDDCDDGDPARYPGAPDEVGDGIDQNCDVVDGTAPPAKIAVPPAGEP